MRVGQTRSPVLPLASRHQECHSEWMTAHGDATPAVMGPDGTRNEQERGPKRYVPGGRAGNGDGGGRRFADRWLDRLTPTVAYGALRAVALGLRWGPGRRSLYDELPGGATKPFAGTFQFSTRDKRVNLYAVIGDGAMQVRRGRAERADVTVVFRRSEHLRAFFTQGDAIFDMLLGGDLVFDGNLSYLARFGHLSLAATQPLAELFSRNGGNGSGQTTHQICDGASGRVQLIANAPTDWQQLTAPPVGLPCPEGLASENHWLDDPYLAGYSLDDFPRLKRLLWAHRAIAPEVCTERALHLTEHVVAERCRGAACGAPALRQARALQHILSRKEAIIYDDDLLAGTTTSRRIGVIIYPETGGVALWPELLTMQQRQLNPYRISPRNQELLDRRIYPFWMDDNVREWARSRYGDPQCIKLDESFVLYFLWKNHAVSHTIANMPNVLARGLEDIRAEAVDQQRAVADPKISAFYQALQVALDGVLDYATRLAARARELAARLPVGRGQEADEHAARRAELLEMARICAKVPAQPAETLHEALQAIWITFLAMHQESMNAGLSVGRLDMWLQPYLAKDLAGVEDRAERQSRIERTIELVGAFMLKATDHLPMSPDLGNRLFGGSSSDQVITLGGVRPDGSSAVCDMTWILLKATEMLRLRDPNMNARYAPGVNSEAYLRRLCELNLLTRATPSIHNDDAMVPALVEQGFALEDARDWGATGCVEPTCCGRHYGHTNCMMFNLVAPFEMTLNDGVHPLLDRQLGPHTGDPRDFDSYEQLLDAYHQQLSWLIDQSVQANNLLGQAHQKLKPTPLLSALIEGPMQSGRDLIDGGAKYNTSGVALVALADIVDSLAAIKILVFDQQRVDFGTLLAALAKDFQGYEPLLAEILAKVPRFGGDHPLPAQIAAELMDFAYARFARQSHYRGGHYVTGYWSMSNHVAFGLLSGALPSGRRRGKAFSPGLTPTPLCRGPLTEQIRAVGCLDPLKLPNNIAFNVKVVPGANDDHAALLDRMTAYVKAYTELGGMQLQFNVVSSDTLRQAMAAPDEYRDLLVRISGYNAYFVELNSDMQQELIERTEHCLGRN